MEFDKREIPSYRILPVQPNLVKGECSKRDTTFCLLNPIIIQVTMVKRAIALSGTV
jgi:hypothetical protein